MVDSKETENALNREHFARHLELVAAKVRSGDLGSVLVATAKAGPNGMIGDASHWFDQGAERCHLFTMASIGAQHVLKVITEREGK